MGVLAALEGASVALKSQPLKLLPVVKSNINWGQEVRVNPGSPASHHNSVSQKSHETKRFQRPPFLATSPHGVPGVEGEAPEMALKS